MTPRLLAVATLVLGAASLYAFLVLLGFGPGSPPALRLLRAGKQRTDVPRTLAPYALADFAALPHAAPLAEVREIQGRGVVFEGFVQKMLWASDGDLHLELVDTPRGPESRDTLYLTAELTPPLRDGAPGWSYETLVAALRPNRGGVTAWERGPARVRVSGWLLFDWQYDKVPSPWAVANAAPRLTGWEIHPVTRIERWDDAALAWREVPR